jgi:hypothetical protein
VYEKRGKVKPGAFKRHTFGILNDVPLKGVKLVKISTTCFQTCGPSEQRKNITGPAYSTLFFFVS